MTTLVTGAGGLLGSHVTTAAALRGPTVALDRRPWSGDPAVQGIAGDLLQGDWLEEVIRETAPSLIVHCAAIVDVDGCERDPGGAEIANGLMPRRVARAAPHDCLVVYISTDGVFDGTRPFMTEEAAPCPRTAYGRSKLRGEWEVRLAAPRHLIVRTNFFGWSSGRKQSSAEWLYAALAAGNPVTMFDDFYFTPLYVVELVARLFALVDAGMRGVVHVAGADRMSKHDFAVALAGVAGLSVESIRRGSIEHAGLLADRPRDMSLRSVRLNEIGAPPPCLDGLRQFVADRKKPLQARLAGPG